MNKLIAATAAFVLVGCAARPEDIQAQYVSHVPYMGWTCEQLGEETIRLNQALTSASVTQSNARSNDTAGVILLGLPVASMSGGNVAPQIAEYKGEIEAVGKAQNLKNCARPPAPPAPVQAPPAKS